MIDTWEKILDPNFINAELIGPAGAERIVTIKDIDFMEAYDMKTNSKTMKQSLILEECKPMILNKTNRKALIHIFGAENPRHCIGKKVVLYVIDTKVGGKPTTGIRIKEYTEQKCDLCKGVIMPAAGHTVDQMVEISRKNTGKCLCLKCMKKEKERMDMEAARKRGEESKQPAETIERTEAHEDIKNQDQEPVRDQGV